MNIGNYIRGFNPNESSFESPFIIAEAGVNHECKIEIAKKLIDQAASSGAHAIKFQTYRAEYIASKNSPAYWDLTKEKTDSQFKLFKKYDKFWKKEFEILYNHCTKSNIEFLSTPFDLESANFLNELMSAFKISSSDLNNKPFIDHLCSFGKPIILSTGASYMWEVERSVEWINMHKVPFSLLHCVLNYPTSDENANLSEIITLKRKFPEIPIGYSDHTLPNDMKVLEIATLLGAKIIEKHFTHDKDLPGNDHYHAMDQKDLSSFVLNIKKIQKILGGDLKKPLQTEMISRKNARRSLVALKEINAGETLSYSHITWKRPGDGIKPYEIEALIGKKARKKIKRDSILKWEMID